jgi:hypothetical protein
MYERVQEKEAVIIIIVDKTQKLLPHCVYETIIWRVVIIFTAPA